MRKHCCNFLFSVSIFVCVSLGVCLGFVAFLHC